MRDAQVGVLRRKRMEGKTQEASAAAAGMAERAQVGARVVPIAAGQAAYVTDAGRFVCGGVRRRSSASAGGGSEWSAGSDHYRAWRKNGSSIEGIRCDQARLRGRSADSAGHIIANANAIYSHV